MANERDKAIEREIRSHHRFTLADAIGQRAGSGFFAGSTIVPPAREAAMALRQYVERHLDDSDGCMRTVLVRRFDETVMSQHLDDPVAPLAPVLHRILHNDEVLYEFVRQVDVEYGRLMDERPHFQRPGQPPHPDDVYTHATVRDALGKLHRQLGGS